MYCVSAWNNGLVFLVLLSGTAGSDRFCINSESELQFTTKFYTWPLLFTLYTIHVHSVHYIRTTPLTNIYSLTIPICSFHLTTQLNDALWLLSSAISYVILSRNSLWWSGAALRHRRRREPGHHETEYQVYNYNTRAVSPVGIHYTARGSFISSMRSRPRSVQWFTRIAWLMSKVSE